MASVILGMQVNYGGLDGGVSQIFLDVPDVVPDIDPVSGRLYVAGETATRSR